jgi:lipoate-protein ligase A
MLPRLRVLVHGRASGAWNMAVDEALLDATDGGWTLRFYAWDRPTISLGYAQPMLRAVDAERARKLGIPLVRRPTGGRAVLHHLELTYAVAAPLGGVLPGALQVAYRRVCAGLVRAARSLGIDAELTGGEVNLRLPGPRTAVPCFEAPAGGEVVVSGRKLIGSSSRARQGCLLQHGAILLDWDGRLQAGAMGLEDDRSLRPRITTFADELTKTPSRSDLVDAFVAGFEDEFGVVLEQAPLSDAETSREPALEEQFSIARVIA